MNNTVTACILFEFFLNNIPALTILCSNSIRQHTSFLQQPPKTKPKKTTQPWKEQQGADSYRDTLEPNLGVHVGDAAVTLGGSVELADLFNAEALSEGLPHAGA